MFTTENTKSTKMKAHRGAWRPAGNHSPALCPAHYAKPNRTILRGNAKK